MWLIVMLCFIERQPQVMVPFQLQSSWRALLHQMLIRTWSVVTMKRRGQHCTKTWPSSSAPGCADGPPDQPDQWSTNLWTSELRIENACVMWLLSEWSLRVGWRKPS